MKNPIYLDKEALTKNLEAVNEHVSVLNTQATNILDEFIEWQNNENKGRENDQKCRLTISIREKNSNLYIAWQLFKYRVKYEGGTNAPVIARHIKKGKGTNKYRVNQLKPHVPAWALDVIMDYEERLAVIRKALRQLSAMRTAINELIILSEDD